METKNEAHPLLLHSIDEMFCKVFCSSLIAINIIPAINVVTVINVINLC
jgi:hypothetical protein